MSTQRLRDHTLAGDPSSSTRVRRPMYSTSRCCGERAGCLRCPLPPERSGALAARGRGVPPDPRGRSTMPAAPLPRLARSRRVVRCARRTRRPSPVPTAAAAASARCRSRGRRRPVPARVRSGHLVLGAVATPRLRPRTNKMDRWRGSRHRFACACGCERGRSSASGPRDRPLRRGGAGRAPSAPGRPPARPRRRGTRPTRTTYGRRERRRRRPAPWRRPRAPGGVPSPARTSW